MTDTTSPRHTFPMLEIAQAQKELFHNEALLMLDLLTFPVIESILSVPPLSLVSTDKGKCWLVGANPSGIWSGKFNFLAEWIGDDWRYAKCTISMTVHDKSVNCTKKLGVNGWTSAPIIAAPSGGTIIDLESRTAIASIISTLQGFGLAVG
jgi:hypothetical protein